MFRKLSKYSLEICVLRKSYFLWEFQAETLYVCPKPCFGQTYKVSAWNSHHKCHFWLNIFARLFWRACEMLVKQPPGHDSVLLTKRYTYHAANPATMKNQFKIYSLQDLLTHWGPAMNFVNSLSSGNTIWCQQWSRWRLGTYSRQAIAQTYAALLSIGPPGTSFSEIWIKMQRFSCEKIYLC